MSGKLFSEKSTKIAAAVAPNVQQQIIDKIHEKHPDLICLKLGSVGKKKDTDYNGDIDIGVKCDSIEELGKIIHDVFDYTDTVDMKTFYIVSICYPYEQDGEQKYVSCDFILVKDVTYTQFRYYCPDYRKDESRYKVGTKIMMVGTILNYCDEKNAGVPKGYYGKYVFSPIGLSRYIINMQNMKDYTTEDITLDVDTIVHIMLNEKGTAEDFNSVETIWDAIHSDKFKYPQYVKAIELAFFKNCYRKCWEEQVKPEDFVIQYWTADEIKEQLKTEVTLRNINAMFMKLQK